MTPGVVKSRILRLGLLAMALGFSVCAYAYPLLAVFKVAFDQDLAGASVLDVLTSGHTRSVIWFTFWQAALSSAVTLIIGLPLAYACGRARIKGARYIEGLTTAAFVLPTTVVAVAFSTLFRPGGILSPLHLGESVWPIIMAHVFFEIGIVVRLVGAAWRRADVRMEEVARTLGASRLRAFRETALPIILPAISAAGALSFLFTFTSFGVVLLLGGERETLEVAIYVQVTQLLDLRAASTLALLQLIVLAAVLVCVRAVEWRAPRNTGVLLPRHNKRGSAAAVMAWIITVIVIGIPMLSLLARSLSQSGGLGFDSYRRLSERPTFLTVSPLQAMAHSLTFALVATVIAVVIGMTTALGLLRRSGGSRVLEVLLSLPLATSGIVIGLGVLLGYGTPPLESSMPRYLPCVQSLRECTRQRPYSEPINDGD